VEMRPVALLLEYRNVGCQFFHVGFLKRYI
jgi:hypothetical protein